MSQDADLQTLSAGDRESGSIGIGAMIVFIALILVAAVASTIIIKTAEELQQNAESTSQDTRDQISGKISISDIYVKSSADPLTVGSGDTDVATLDVIARVSSGSLNVQEGDITWYVTCKVTYTDDSATFAVVDTETADARALSDNEGIDPENLVTSATYTIDAVGNSDWTTVAATSELTGGTGAVGDQFTATGQHAAGSTGTVAENNYMPGDEITAGTTFRFEIDLGDTNTNSADDVIDADDFGATTPSTPVPGCDAEAGAGSELGLRVVVDGGGETLATLKIQSITLGKTVM
ncbi:MAG: hypothetical protein VX909_00150 [Candidatus Thermoplasmatota archaeon]|nr:hypothetical protein [Candidatus Thermoplasmatota archaeon]